MSYLLLKPLKNLTKQLVILLARKLITQGFSFPKCRGAYNPITKIFLVNNLQLTK